jgi:hypothetical protein
VFFFGSEGGPAVPISKILGRKMFLNALYPAFPATGGDDLATNHSSMRTGDTVNEESEQKLKISFWGSRKGDGFIRGILRMTYNRKIAGGKCLVVP